MNRLAHWWLVAAVVLAAGLARADVTVGVSLPLTGPASGLGIPIQNELNLWPGCVAVKSSS